MKKIPKITICVFLILAMLVLSPLAIHVLENTETCIPEQSCILCNYFETNSPCLVNLSTGDIGEIRLYDPAKNNRAEIDSDKTEYGGALISSCVDGVLYVSYPDKHFSDITINSSYVFPYSAEQAEKFLCEGCMEKVAALKPSDNFIVADLYDKATVKLYRAEDAQDGINVRHYNIVIGEKKDDAIHLKMTSSFFTCRESELDY